MTLLRPGKKAKWTLEDGRVIELQIGTDSAVDEPLAAPPSFGGMDIDALSGRQLDALVARRVFGYEVEPRANARTGEKDFVQKTPSGQDWVRVAFYSAGGAAINVEVELQKRGWKRATAPRLGSQWNEPGDPTVVLEHADGRRVEAFGPMNVAICRAALKAVAPTAQ